MMHRLAAMLTLLLGFAALSVEPTAEVFLKELSPVRADPPKPNPVANDVITPGTYRWFTLMGKDGKPYTGSTTWYANGQELVESKDSKGNAVLSADLPNSKVIISDAAGWIMGEVSGSSEEAPRHEIPEKAVVVYGKRGGSGTLTLIIDTVVKTEAEGKEPAYKAKRLLTKVYSIAGVPPDDQKKKDEEKKDEGKKDEEKKDGFSKAEHVYAAIIHDARNMQPDYAPILNNKTFWDTVLTSKGGKTQVFDLNPPAGKSTSDAMDRGYVNLASKVQTGNGPYKPALILLDWDTGKLLRPVTVLGKTTEENEKLIKEVQK